MGIRVWNGKILLRDFTDQGILGLIHGGAGPMDPKRERVVLASNSICSIGEDLKKWSAVPYSYSHFLDSHCPVNNQCEGVVLLGARYLEDNPLFNAGLGAALQEDGIPRLSAAFMSSEQQKFSAVMNVTEVLHPSELAFYLQGQRFCVLDHRGGNNLAHDLQVPRAELRTRRRFDRWVELKRQTLEGIPSADGTGTIGCVAVSSSGKLAAVTSTGGVGNETVGRVGDTPTIAGNYCTDKVAVSCTGYGEEIVNIGLAPRIAARVEDGMSLVAAMNKTLHEAGQLDYQLAAIAVARDANQQSLVWCAGTTTKFFIWSGFSDRNRWDSSAEPTGP